MRALSLVGVAGVSMALLVRAETPAPAVSPTLSPAPSIGCNPCPLAPPPLPAPARPDDPTLPPLPANPLATQTTRSTRGWIRSGTPSGLAGPEWRNTTGQPQSALPFHLYFLEPSATRLDVGAGEDAAPARLARARRRAASASSRSRPSAGHGRRRGDLTPASLPAARRCERGRPDGGRVRRPPPSRPTPPRGSRSTGRRRCRTARRAVGMVHDYHFVAQWFPRSAFPEGRLNAHQFHPFSEFFLHYGVATCGSPCPRADPGATGAMKNAVDNPDGTRTFHLHQDDVHDFACDQPAHGRSPRASTSPATTRWTSACSSSPNTGTWPRATSRPRRPRYAATARGPRPIPTTRSRASIPPGPPPRGAWNTRPCSRAARPSSRRPPCRARRA